jgi:hypothetical protein
MTHSLHREGTLDSLERDYCMFIYPGRGFNYKGSAPKVRKLMEITYGSGPANTLVTTLRENLYSEVATPEEILDSIKKDGARVFSTFHKPENLKQALIKFKEEDLGISIVVSGLIDKVRDMAREVGLTPHTINVSLGIHGRTELLPPPDIRQFTTMCGHAMVAPNLVRENVRKIKKGRAEPFDASVTLAKPCACGIYNPYRSVELLNDLTPVYTVTRW